MPEKEDKAKSMQYSLFFIQRFKGKVLFSVPMSDYTSFRIGGPADVMAFPEDEADLKDIILFAESKGFPFYVLGAATNLLVRDGGIRGIVINMTEGFKDITWLEDDKAAVGAGVGLQGLISECRAKGLGGLEFACGIPGTIGGAVSMNAGAYGREMKDIVEGVEFMGRKGQKGYLTSADAGFSYRKTSLPKGAIVIRANIRFEKKNPEEISAKLQEYRDRRKAAAEIRYPNAGSIFKNPEGGKGAGKLIEEAGLKGARMGDAEVSTVHANYIVNRGRALARDVLGLMAMIRDKVYGTSGIVLEPEIKVAGEDLGA